VGLACLVAAACAAGSTSRRVARATAATAIAPPIHHVFVIVLENESASTTFGANSPAPYLARTLPSEGAYLPDYYGIGHESLDNYIAMVSGQAPNLETQTDCQLYENLIPGTIGADGQASGEGCVYPAGVPTIASQLTAAGLTWRDYNDGMGADPGREPAECAHPAIGARDNTQAATAADQYATRHNPFVYFHSIIDDTALCDSHVVNLDLLAHDLGSASSTPNYVFITPNLCDDGHDAKCAGGGPGGLARVNTFLQEWVPRITSSPAFREQNGLLIVAFDEAATSDAHACCGEVPGPGSLLPGLLGAGGGDTGAVLLSPCIAPGTVSRTPYNHYSLLRSVEDLFGLSHLGEARLPGERGFGSDVYTRSCASAAPLPTVRLRVGGRRRVRRGESVALRWAATRAPARSYAVQERELSPRRTGWRTLARSTRRRTWQITVPRGELFEVRVRGTAAAGGGRWASVRVSGR
jgi:hypothetical protein